MGDRVRNAGKTADQPQSGKTSSRNIDPRTVDPPGHTHPPSLPPSLFPACDCACPKVFFVGKLPSLPNKESSHTSCLCLIIHTIQHLLARSSFLFTSLVKKSVRRHFDLHKKNIASPPWPPLPSGRQTWRRSTCRTWRSRSSAATASPCGPPGLGGNIVLLDNRSH